MEITTLPRIIQKNAADYPYYVAQYSKDEGGIFQPTSYSEMYREILAFAAGLREAGIKRGDHVGLISDNRKEWLITSFALPGSSRRSSGLRFHGRGTFVYTFLRGLLCGNTGE